MYGWDLWSDTAKVAEKPYKEPWKRANDAIVTHKPG
jgi:hypothetical protein